MINQSDGIEKTAHKNIWSVDKIPFANQNSADFAIRFWVKRMICRLDCDQIMWSSFNPSDFVFTQNFWKHFMWGYVCLTRLNVCIEIELYSWVWKLCKIPIGRNALYLQLSRNDAFWCWTFHLLLFRSFERWLLAILYVKYTLTPSSVSNLGKTNAIIQCMVWQGVLRNHDSTSLNYPSQHWVHRWTFKRAPKRETEIDAMEW